MLPMQLLSWFRIWVDGLQAQFYPSMVAIVRNNAVEKF